MSSPVMMASKNGAKPKVSKVSSCVLRDAEYHALIQEIAELRYAPRMAAWYKVLGAKMSARQRVVLRVALSYYTWRTLVRDAGLTQGAAVGAMVEAVDGAN